MIHMRYISNRVLVFVAVTLLASCSLDINEDPNNPTTASEREILPIAQVGTLEALADYPNNICSSVVQTRVSNRHDNYTLDLSVLTNVWNSELFSGGLNDLETVIKQGSENENWHYVGIAQLLKAYAFSIMVDLWNDIPYSDAFQPDLEVIEYDLGSEVYNDLILLIGDAKANLKGASANSPSTDDVIYEGDLAQWEKMANTLLMKLYLQTRLVDSDAGSKIQGVITEGGFIADIADDFQLKFGSSSSPENRHPLFVIDYVIRLDNRISTYFGNLLYGNNDPRIPFYFFNQTPGEFIGRDAGNPNGLSQFEDQDIRTFHGVYPSGGAYDDGQGGITNANMGLQGAGTFRMMTNAQRLFMEAEAVHTLGVQGSADLRTLFEDGMREAMKKVNELGVGATIADEDIDAYVNMRLASFDQGTDEEKLRLIMMEKYIHQFGNGIEQFNDWRRTGYPDNLELVVEIGTIINRFPYPSTENPPSRPSNNELVFWDN